ncbi:hypothetical protein JHU38_06130 [Prevotella sp. A2931]|uniref:Lipoprotein n=1 Tax=Prevotella illustrans TaxID=2800387 RepID=A0ABS3M596_9BACT|nr:MULTISPECIES: hypothetical protein [Prevotella]MBO1363354.1 hypothetical protein [Prevotella illustrans]PTL26989.1 hypothetical protein C3V39_08105 [Prevotella sp. oral taxon 820]
MKRILFYLLLLCCGTAFVACSDDNSEAKDIQVGADDLKEVALNKLSTRTIILRGGTGKYTANVADSKIAGVAISKDTLRISGILEGQTYATIISGDFKRRVDINVVVPELSISQSEIRLFPRDESKFVSLNGGGDFAELQIEDPDKIMNAKWNAKTGILEIQAHYEGEAKIRVIAQDKKEKTLKVVVRCEGTADRVGVYSTTSRSIYTHMNTIMAVRRPGIGVWFCSGARPYTAKRVLKITPAVVNPVVGSHVNVTLSMTYPDEFSNSGLKEGQYKLFVEEVREHDAVLRGQGFKLVIPYEKK